jgi:hypothetical protein
VQVRLIKERRKSEAEQALAAHASKEAAAEQLAAEQAAREAFEENQAYKHREVPEHDLT